MSGPAESQEHRAARLHADSLVIDALNTPYAPRIADVETFLTHVRRGGVNAVHVTLHERSADGWGWDAVLRCLAMWAQRFRHHRHDLAPVFTAHDIDAARHDGQVAVILGLQNAACLEQDCDRLQTLAQLGVRIVQLTYNGRNLIGDGCRETDDQGLSELGERAVRRCNELGLLVDVSHCSPRTTMDATRHARAPVAATHVGAHAVYPHPRNRTDDELRAIADTGGVVGVIGVPLFLRREGPDSIDDMLDHLEHIANVVGIDRVGVGHDNFVHPDAGHFRVNDAIGLATGTDGLEQLMPAAAMPPPQRWATYHEARLTGFDGIVEWPNFTRHLVQRGYSDAEISGVIGGNWRRLFADVWNDDGAN